MRVALISLYDDRCYGLRHLASFLRRQGHEVWVLCFKRFLAGPLSPDDPEVIARVKSASYEPVTDASEEGTYVCPYLHPATEREWQLLLERLGTIRPDLIGVTLNTASFDPACELTERIHRELPGIPVVWGGVHPTICPEECLQVADVVVLGEGEHTLAELCADPERTDVAGLWRKKDGEIIRNPLRPLEQNLDIFPFPSYGESEWLFDDDKATELPASETGYYRVIYILMTQRGCPFQCSYCVHHQTRPMYSGQRYLRRRSVDNVLDECEQRMRDFELYGFGFFDDVFLIDRKWIGEFAEKYPKRIGLPFGGYAYPNVSTEDMFPRLAAAGMAFVGLGIQTGSEYISREIYGRSHSGEDFVKLAQLADSYHMDLIYDLMSNCPYESEADCHQTLDLLTRLPKPLQMGIKRIVFFPGSRIATLDKPKPNLPPETFEFWNQLYLLSQHHLVPREHLLALSKDEYLKANPEILRHIARSLKRTVEKEKATLKQLDDALAREQNVTLRSVLRCAKRLLGKWLRRFGLLPKRRPPLEQGQQPAESQR